MAPKKCDLSKLEVIGNAKSIVKVVVPEGCECRTGTIIRYYAWNEEYFATCCPDPAMEIGILTVGDILVEGPYPIEEQLWIAALR